MEKLGNIFIGIINMAVGLPLSSSLLKISVTSSSSSCELYQSWIIVRKLCRAAKDFLSIIYNVCDIDVMVPGNMCCCSLAVVEIKTRSNSVAQRKYAEMFDLA